MPCLLLVLGAFQTSLAFVMECWCLLKRAMLATDDRDLLQTRFINSLAVVEEITMNCFSPGEEVFLCGSDVRH